MAILLLASCILISAIGGCKFWKSPARELQRANEDAIAELEASRAAAEIKRADAASARDQTLETSIQAAALAEGVSQEAAEKIRIEAAKRVDEFNRLVARWDAEIQHANNALADRLAARAPLKHQVDAEDARVDRGFGLLEAALTVGTALGGGSVLAGVQAVVRSTRKKVAKARAEGELSGRRIGIGITMDSIETAKVVSPKLAEEFEKLTAEQKRAIHTVLDQLPEWRSVFVSDSPTRIAT